MSNLNSFITPEKGKKQQKDHVEIKKKGKRWTFLSLICSKKD